MNWMSNHGTLKALAHINYIVVEKWEYFKLLSASITKDACNKTRLIPLFPPYQDTNTQSFLADAQTPKGKILEEIETI